MAGLDHGPASPDEPEDMELAATNARGGLILFLLYFVLYAAYVASAAFSYKSFSAPSQLSGTWAIDFGMTLILGAMGVAVAYGWICRRNYFARQAQRKQEGGGQS